MWHGRAKAIKKEKKVNYRKEVSEHDQCWIEEEKGLGNMVEGEITGD